jgi:uncharacterized membrane protein (DUF485 family)
MPNQKTGSPGVAATTPVAPSQSLYESIANDRRFQELLVAKKRFIVPATVFFIVYYFALPVLVGYAPDFMKTPVIGPVNLAYLFALSQFVVAWIIAWLYMRASDRFDEQGRELLKAPQPPKAGRG